SGQTGFTRWMIKHPSINLEQSKPAPILIIDYHGLINDSPKMSGGLRFVRPDKTNGHIGPQGIYLTSETFWYPTWEHHLVTFDLALNLPSDWRAVTQGQESNQAVTENPRTSQWSISSPAEALTLVANHFVVQKKPWRDIQLATYLFPAEAPLAQQYLDATATYLDLYTNLLGPYPFSQFAVVENFFPSGLGMPSFTLLGHAIVRRGYTQPYSLGHEIVHSWLGNSVFNDFAKGNWVEGLTTYLSNYYYDEATANHTAAIKTRRRMMDEFNLYATPEKDYPIHQFHHKETRIDNAVGYQKTALVFHMLRQELGDDAFFKGIRQIIQEGTGQYFEWKDLKRVFSQVAERDLTEFFKQWVEQPGAPSVTLHDLSVRPDPLRSDQSIVSGTISQKNGIYTMPLPIKVNLQDESTISATLKLDQTSQPITLNVTGIPTSITLDPEHHWLLRLQREQLPPMLNGWDTDTRRILVHDKTASKEEEASLQALMRRIQGQPDIEVHQNDSPAITEAASYLIIGTLARQLLESKTFQTCNKNVQMESGHITILDQVFEGPDMAFLITCPHPNFLNHTVSLFFGLSPEAVTPVARLLFFYGWDSYLVFQQGKVVARGMFQPVHSAREFTFPAPLRNNHAF
ncbi:MAG: M1 family aminopeptidase, partial [Nitrospirota bacterium]|nr:M1 family aminopeptidase [Nitrospirota bacterium]